MNAAFAPLLALGLSGGLMGDLSDVRSVSAQTCPAAPDHAQRVDEIHARLQDVRQDAAAQPLIRQLWLLWTDAPDARAQELLDRGMSRRAAYDFDAAQQALDALVAYCPDYAEGYNQRAFVAFLRADYATALEDLDRALMLSQTHSAAMAGKAMTLLGLGRIKAAHGVLRAALKLNPWLPERGMLPKTPGQEL